MNAAPEPDGTIDAVLIEVRAIAAGLTSIGEDTTAIKAHLAEIDVQLAAMPQRPEIDELSRVVEELRVIVGELQADVGKLKAFVEGDPPLKDRLVALEENVAAFKVATEQREEGIAEVAGVATDSEHEAATRGITDPQFTSAAGERETMRHQISESEARSELNIGNLRDRLGEVILAVREMQGTTLLLMTIGSLIGAVVLFVAVWALSS